MQREKVEWKNWKLCSAKILTRTSKEEGKRGRKKFDGNSNFPLKTNITLIKNGASIVTRYEWTINES